MSHIVCTQWGGQHLHDKARSRVKKSQHMGHRKATTESLTAWLAEYLSQFRCVRHAERGAVHMVGTVPAPAFVGINRRSQSHADTLQEFLEHHQRQTASRLCNKPLH